MKATFPIITCDHEDGCDQWTLDWYEALVSNWRSAMEKGWQYDPFRPDDPQLCPEHAAAGLVDPTPDAQWQTTGWRPSEAQSVMDSWEMKQELTS